MVKDGGLATVGLSQYELGEKTGEHVVRILQGKENCHNTSYLHGKRTSNVKRKWLKT